MNAWRAKKALEESCLKLQVLGLDLEVIGAERGHRALPQREVVAWIHRVRLRKVLLMGDVDEQRNAVGHECSKARREEHEEPERQRSAVHGVQH